MLSRLFSALALCALTLSWVSTPAWAQAPAAAFVVMDNASGHILNSANADKKLQIASLTKIASAMVVLDWSEARGQDLNQLATISATAVALPTSENAVPLQAGDQVSLKDLLYISLLQSNNQAAQTLGEHVGRSLGEGDPATLFVQQMNALGRKVGMKNTRFLNAHGLDELEKRPPYSTAEDLALLARYAMERAAFRFQVSQTERKVQVQTATGPQGFMVRNTNELLGVDSIDGVKTGTTRRAGQCLITSAAKAPESRQEGEKHFITPRRLTVVVLGAADRFGFSRSLMSRGWQQHESWVAAGRPTESQGAPQKKKKGGFLGR
jgi:serine-type D-Ala-D-Ala carboxypeptidase (penicillin-binding protein 5/6)